MENLGKKLIFYKYPAKIRQEEDSKDNIYIDCSSNDSLFDTFSNIPFINKISTQKELQKRRYLNKYHILRYTAFLTNEMKSLCGELTSKVLNALSFDIKIEKNLNFHNFNFITLDRYTLGNQLYAILQLYFSLAKIFDHFNPKSVEIIGKMPKYEYDIIISHCNQYHCSLKQIEKNQTTSSKFLTLLNFILTMMSIQNLFWNLRNNFRVKKSNENRAIKPRNTILIYATTQVQSSAVIPVINTLRKTQKKVNIACLSYDVTQKNITQLYNRNGFLLIRNGLFRYYLKIPKVSVNSDIFLKEIRELDLFSIIFNNFPEIKPISRILVDWLHYYLKEKIPDILKRVWMIWHDVKAIHPRILIIANEYLLTQKILTMIAKKQGFLSVLIPHAQISSFFGLSKIETDLVAAQGTHAQNYMISLGTDPAKIILTGMPKYDPLYQTYMQNAAPNKIKEDTFRSLGLIQGKKVVLVASCSDEVERDVKVQYLESILKLLKQFNDLNIVIKLHPRENPATVNNLLAMHNLNYPVVQFFSLYDLILISDVLFTHKTGTTFEGMLFEKPSIEVNYETSDDIFEYAKYNSVYLVDNPNDLENALNLMLYNDIERQKIILGQKKYLEYDLYRFDGKSSERIAKLLTKTLQL